MQAKSMQKYIKPITANIKNQSKSSEEKFVAKAGLPRGSASGTTPGIDEGLDDLLRLPVL